MPDLLLRFVIAADSIRRAPTRHLVAGLQRGRRLARGSAPSAWSATVDSLPVLPVLVVDPRAAARCASRTGIVDRAPLVPGRAATPGHPTTRRPRAARRPAPVGPALRAGRRRRSAGSSAALPAADVTVVTGDFLAEPEAVETAVDGVRADARPARRRGSCSARTTTSCRRPLNYLAYFRRTRKRRRLAQGGRPRT